MTIYIFGNEIVSKDSLPIKLLPLLKKQFPHISFITVDPTESWTNNEKDIIIIDTVVGLKTVTVFHSLNEFQKPPNVSLHDYDVYTDLLFRKKLGMIEHITIIGVPEQADQKEIVGTLLPILQTELQ